MDNVPIEDLSNCLEMITISIMGDYILFLEILYLGITIDNVIMEKIFWHVSGVIGFENIPLERRY